MYQEANREQGEDFSPIISSVLRDGDPLWVPTRIRRCSAEFGLEWREKEKRCVLTTKRPEPNFAAGSQTTKPLVQNII